MSFGMDSQSQWDTLKCVVVGDSAVGKTCLLIRFKDKKFDPDYYVPTVFENYTVDYKFESTQYTLSLHDTAGHEEYDRLRPLTYAAASIFLLCYSVIDRKLFQNISEKWLPELKHYNPQTPIMLVGTKLDLREEGKSSFVDADSPQTDPSVVAHVECSSKTGEGVEEVFEMAVRMALQGLLQKKKKKKQCSLL